MNWFSANLILGLILILLGVSIFLKELLDISLPLVRLALAIFFIYLGISIISNMHNKHRKTAYFSQQIVQPQTGDPSSYQTIFGDSTIDFTNLDYHGKQLRFRISTIFGNCTLYIDPAVPTHINTDTSFGEILLPDNSSSSFGTRTYNSHGTKPELVLRVRTVFGKTTIKEK